MKQTVFRKVVLGILGGIALGTGGAMGASEPGFWLGIIPVLLYLLRSCKDHGVF